MSKDTVYVLTCVFSHAMDSGSDKTVGGVFKTRKAAIAAGEAYRRKHDFVTPYGYKSESYQHQYEIAEKKIR